MFELYIVIFYIIFNNKYFIFKKSLIIYKMEKIKKYWKEIIIVILVIFGLNKCTQSCSRSSEINKLNTEIVSKDSIIKVYDDSINILNTKIQIYDEKISGLNNALNIQDEANKRISEAKKNINVTVKGNGKK